MLNNFFGGVKNLNQLHEFLSINDKERYDLFINTRTITTIPYNTKTYDFSFTELVYTVNPEDFEENTKGLLKLKSNPFGTYDLAPTIYGPWAKVNYANGNNMSAGEFYDVGKSLVYDIGSTYNARDKWNVHYLTDKKYCFNVEINTLARFNDVPKRLSSQAEDFYAELNSFSSPLGVTEGAIRTQTMEM